MKKLVFLVALALTCKMSFAQEQTEKYVQYRGVASMGLGIELGDNDADALMVSTTHGAYINQKLFVGGGAELKYFVTPNDKEDYEYDELLYRTKYLISVYFDFGHDFAPKGKFVPYCDLRVGYSFNIYDEEEYNDNMYAGGIYLMPMAGVRMSHISIWTGYNFVQAKYTMTYRQCNKSAELNYIAFGASLNFGRL